MAERNNDNDDPAAPELSRLIELKRRTNEEIICAHLGMINASLASIANDIRALRAKVEEEFDG